MSAPTITLPATGTYRVDPAASSIAFTTKHMFGLAGVKGTIAIKSGSITVAEPVTASTVEASADVSTFKTDKPKRDAPVKSPDFLHAEQHPEITFRSTTFAPKDGGYVVLGTLTARGADADLELIVTSLAPTADGLAITATGSVDRYAHGITKLKGMAGRHLHLVVTATAQKV